MIYYDYWYENTNDRMGIRNIQKLIRFGKFFIRADQVKWLSLITESLSTGRSSRISIGRIL